MHPNNDSPLDVTLEKSPSGTWKAQKVARHSFKPWQRLWCVTGILYLFMLAGSYHLLMPTQERIEQQMVLAVTEEVKRYDGMAFAGESPRKTFEQFQSLGHAAWIVQIRSKYRIGPEGNAEFDKIELSYREALTDLPVKRIIGILICVAAWMVPMALLYTIGFVMDWIKRGVRVMQG
jgi:hypothetical protein